MREWESQDHDTSFIYDDVATVSKMLGINLRTRKFMLMNGSTRREPAIYYSGFGSQGDGAYFEGSYSYATGAPKAIKAHAPNDTELLRIAESLQQVQKANFYQINASISHSGRYSHSGTMRVSVERDSPNYQNLTVDAEDDITQLMRDFADWIYKQLETDYYYRMSNEAIDEAIEANEYSFDEHGNFE